MADAEAAAERLGGGDVVALARSEAGVARTALVAAVPQRHGCPGHDVPPLLEQEGRRRAVDAAAESDENVHQARPRPA